MAKFNRAETFTVHDARTEALAASSPVIKTAAVATAVNHQGGAGHARDAKSELFLLAVTNMVGEKTYYEDAAARDGRFERLVRDVTRNDPGWMLNFVRWLRNDANMRTASIVAACQAVKERTEHYAAVEQAHVTGERVQSIRMSDPHDNDSTTSFSRAIIDAAIQRADEPGELLAYWTATFGRKLPKPVKRGVADAVGRLYNERNLLKYDTDSHGFRFGDVVDLVHPSPAAEKRWQGDLFAYALGRRRGRTGEIPESLRTLAHRAELQAMPQADRRAFFDRLVADGTAATVLEHAAMTWESLAGWLGGPMDAAAWSAMIPSMGYMSLLRNLRNFDEAGVSDEVAAAVAAKLADPAEVAKSRQLPMRFLSAYRAAPSLRWSYPLEQALGHCLGNIPALPGRTLVLVDTSGSMRAGFSKDGTLMRWDAAVLFGVALAQRCSDADVVSFSDTTKVFSLKGGESLLKSLDRWRTDGYFIGSGTSTGPAIRKHFAGHDRVVVLTDEQETYHGSGPANNRLGANAAVPETTPLITFNLAGYRHGHAPSGTATRVTVGGLTDQAFRMIPLVGVERGGRWPWQE